MVKNIPAIERSTEIRFGKHVPDSTDQADNTIVFNASNVLVPTPYSNAVYLSPIRNRPDFTPPEVVLLMYDRNTKEITESGESANALVGGVTLALAVDRANVTSNTVQFRFSDNNTGFVTDSNVGISNLLPQHTVSVGSNLYIDEFGSNVLVVSGNVAVLRDMVIDGNLRVNGDTTVIYAENTAIKDAFIELGQNNTSEDTTLDLGVLMHRPEALSNVVIGYREDSDEFAIGYTDAKPTDKIFTPKTDEDINVHVYGLTHVDANIYAHEDLVVDGNVYVSQNVSVTEELTVSGNVYADKDLEVVGNTYVDGNVVASQDFTLSGNAYVSGNIVASQDLTLSGNTYISGNIVASQDLTMSGNAYVTGNIVASQDLTLSGNTYISGNIVASQDLTMSGNAYVSGNVSVTEELTVSGNVYADKDLEVVGNVFVDGNVVAYQDILVTGNVYVSTNVSVTEELTVSGNVYADKDLEVVGNVYVDGNVVAYQDLLVTGNVYAYTNVEIARELTITGNAYADRDLEVAGNVYVDGNVVAYQDILVTGNVYVSTNVSVSKELTVTGNVYADKDLEVVGNTYVSGNVEVTKDLIVTGNTHLEGPNVFITHTMDFLDPTTAIVTDLNSNVEVKLNQLANVVIGTKALANEDMLVYDGSNWTNQLQNHTFLYAKAEEVIAKGDAVYATGTVGNNTFSIRKAQSNSSATMPALGLAYQAFTLNQQGLIVTFGRSDGINTDNFITGETVYVSNVTAGALSNVKPYGATDLIQNIGLVVKGHPSTGIVSVTGVGRSNDIPNAVIETSNASVNYVYVNSVNNDLRKIDPMKLPTKLQPLTNVVNTGNTAANAVTLRGLSITSGNGFNGDLTVTGNVSIDNDTLAVDSISHRVGLKTTSPNSNLHVVGNVFVTSNITTNSNIFVVGEAAATSKTTGALQVTGGVGVQGDIHATHANLEDVEADSITVTDTTAATDKTSGALQVAGGVGIQGDLYATDGTFTTNVYITNHTDLNNKHLAMIDTNGSLIQSPVYVAPSGKYVISAAEAEFLGNITLGGNTTLLTSTSLIVEDRIIGIGSNNTTEGFDSGIIIEHEDEGVFANVALIHHADEHRFSIGYTQNTLSDNHILHAAHPDNIILQIDLNGNTIVENSLSVYEMGTYGTKVGIATTEPVANIHVVGNAFVTSNITTSSNVLITGDAAATSKTTGALQVAGGVGVQGDIHATHANLEDVEADSITVTDTTTSSSTTTGALKVAGGMSTQEKLNVGGITKVWDSTAVTSKTDGALVVVGGVGISGDIHATHANLEDVEADSLTVTDTTTSSSTTTGALKVAGGMSTQEKLNVGGITKVWDSTAVTSKTDGALVVVGGVGISGDIHATHANLEDVEADSLTVTDTTVATNKTSGALQVAGGVGVQGDLYAAAATFDDLTVDGTTLTVDTGNNRVGIGMNNPGYALDVTGDFNVSGNLRIGGVPFFSSQWTTSGSDIYYTSGNVGIGGANPAHKLDVYGTSNVGALTATTVTVPDDGDFIMNSKPLVPASGLHWDRVNNRLGVGTSSPATKLHVAGGTIINSDGVAKKTYSYSGDLTSGQTVANSTIVITFSQHVFYAKIVAHLVESDNEVSTLSLECGGGNWSGGTPLAIAKGPQAIFGSASTNPWSSTVTTSATTVSIKPTTNMAVAGHYNVFIEYISQHSSGVVSKITEGGIDVVSFGY
jgi:cytoskeletal protein CcmA (bactofilin family)